MEEPPKTHDLRYLAGKLSLEPPDELLDFLNELNEKSVPTRYPDVLHRMKKEYNRKRTAEILKKSGELQKWIKEQY